MTDGAESRGRVTRRSVLASAASSSIAVVAGCTAASDDSQDDSNPRCVNGGLKDKYMRECKIAGPLDYDGTIQEISAKGYWWKNPVREVKVTTGPIEEVLTVDLFVDGTPKSKEIPPSPSEAVRKFNLCSDRYDGSWGEDGSCADGSPSGEYTVQVRRKSEVVDRKAFKFSEVDTECEHGRCFEIEDIEVDDGQ